MGKSSEKQKVKDTKLVRDTKTKALLNTDIEGLNNYKKKLKTQKETNKKLEKIPELEKQVQDLINEMSKLIKKLEQQEKVK